MQIIILKNTVQLKANLLKKFAKHVVISGNFWFLFF